MGSIRIPHNVSGCGKSNMVAINLKRLWETYNSACRIPKDTPMMSMASNSMMLLQELSDASGRRKSKMAATINRKYLYLMQLLFGHSPFELLEHDNMGVAVEISLLSCIQAEIYVISYKKSSYWLPLFICPLSRRRTIFALVQSCCLTPKTWI